MKLGTMLYGAVTDAGRGKSNQLSHKRVNFWQGRHKIGHEVATHLVAKGEALAPDEKAELVRLRRENKQPVAENLLNREFNPEAESISMGDRYYLYLDATGLDIPGGSH